LTANASSGGTGFFEWINRHTRPVTVALIIGAIAFLFIGESVKTDEDVSFEPKGEIYDTAERADDLLSPATSVVGAVFLVEDPAGVDVLTRTALLEYKLNSDALRSDATAQTHLASVFNNDIGVQIEGVFSLAHAVDEALPSGLAGAGDTDVKLALHDHRVEPRVPGTAHGCVVVGGRLPIERGVGNRGHNRIWSGRGRRLAGRRRHPRSHRPQVVAGD
jgi:hypothetical protein